MTTTLDRPRPARERLVRAANLLFHLEGIRATSADRVAEEAAVSKMTFYRHFPSKDDLVVAYLDSRAGEEHAIVAELEAAHPDDPRAVLLGWADVVGTYGCLPTSRGCSHVNAAAEYPDADTSVRQAVARQRAWIKDTAARLFAMMGRDEPAVLAAQFLVARDGALAATELDGDDEQTRRLCLDVVTALVAD